MLRTRRFVPLVLAAACGVPSTARASGFLLHEQTAAALGRAGAMVADAPGAGAVWFNPAALSDAPTWGAEVTGAAVRGGARFSPDGGGASTRTRTETHIVPNLFTHARVARRWQVGLGLFAPFGLVVRWPDDWVGAEKAISTDLRLITTNGVAAFEVTPRLAIGGGLSLARGTVELAAALPSNSGGGRVELDGDGWGVGANLAALWRLSPGRLHLGASYRSRIRVPFHGRADFTLNNPTFADALVDQGASATITFPDVFNAGVMFRPWQPLALLAQVDLVLWSTFDELRVDFDNRTTTPYFTAVRNTGNPPSLRLAAEGTLPLALVARAGVSLDGQALPAETLAPSTPDARRLGLAVGGGWSWRRLHVDVGYLYTRFFEARAIGGREGPPGTYRTRAHAVGVSLGVR